MPASDAVQSFLSQHGIKALSGRTQLIKLVQAVAAIPWGAGRTVEEVLSTKRVGTCTGKHLVLAACCDTLKIPYRTVVCTFRWSEQGLALPDHLKAILAEGEWVHGHNFMQLQSAAGEWIDIDITWDTPLQSAGFLTFPENWDGETPVIGLRAMVERMDGADISLKDTLTRSLPPEMRERRERFLAAFIAWIAELRR